MLTLQKSLLLSLQFPECVLCGQVPRWHRTRETSEGFPRVLLTFGCSCSQIRVQITNAELALLQLPLPAIRANVLLKWVTHRGFPTTSSLVTAAVSMDRAIAIVEAYTNPAIDSSILFKKEE